MKICMLSAFYHPITAGSEVFTKEISERLAKDGHEVHVVTGAWLRLDHYEKINGVHVHRVPSMLITNLALPSVAPGMFFKGLQIAKECDIIHAHLAFPPGVIGSKIKKLTGKPLITTVQGGDMGIYPDSGLGRFFPLLKFHISRGLKNADTVTAISHFLEHKAEELGAKSVVLIRNGTDIKRFNPKVPVEKIKKKYKIKGDPLIVSVSRLVPKNGTHVLIPAFAQVLEDFPKAKLVIAGDGPELAALEKQAHDFGISDSIMFLGYVQHDEIPAFMNMADVFVRVSLEEGLGIVFTEAMACKTPIVGTDVGGIPDIVKNLETGMLVPPNDVDETASAIKKILADKKASKKMAEKGYKMIQEEFTWDSIYAKMLDLYKNCVQE